MRRIVYLLFMAMGIFSLGTIEQPAQQSAGAQIQQSEVKQDNSYFSDVMNKASDETLVAAHYSHSSHSSHSSHRSHYSSRY
ncbi:His-Xaa-Ser repeat protein HxsA2 [uncultured Desulfovibrio sp.]|uniref:His-Xaa-Ser repeat protein HxsA2 n=1 Tax=uncultured Desulfovibrio sp. TaxID=167968 RepID=UPI0026388E86|nr:His-Xaa-Ser repeat protein HxsA2 [uncultured Desulfovibrio sp.]